MRARCYQIFHENWDLSDPDTTNRATAMIIYSNRESRTGDIPHIPLHSSVIGYNKRENKPNANESHAQHVFFSSTISSSSSRRERMITGNGKISLSLSLSHVFASRWRLGARSAGFSKSRVSAARRERERQKERQRRGQR